MDFCNSATEFAARKQRQEICSTSMFQPCAPNKAYQPGQSVKMVKPAIFRKEESLESARILKAPAGTICTVVEQGREPRRLQVRIAGAGVLGWISCETLSRKRLIAEVGAESSAEKTLDIAELQFSLSSCVQSASADENGPDFNFARDGILPFGTEQGDKSPTATASTLASPRSLFEEGPFDAMDVPRADTGGLRAAAMDAQSPTNAVCARTPGQSPSPSDAHGLRASGRAPGGVIRSFSRIITVF